MAENLSIYEKCREVPESAKKTIGAGRLKGKTDINPMWRIKKLTEIFGPCGIGWYYDVDKKWTEEAGGEIAAFVDINLYIKSGGEWSKPIHGTGGSMLAANEKGGLHLSDECYKMATTDAISVACKQLGIGADVYWSADNTKYTQGGRTPSYDGSGAAPAPMLKQIESICQKHGTTPEYVCQSAGVQWKGISAELAGQMLVFLKQKYGDE